MLSKADKSLSPARLTPLIVSVKSAVVSPILLTSAISSVDVKIKPPSCAVKQVASSANSTLAPIWLPKAESAKLSITPPYLTAEADVIWCAF